MSGEEHECPTCGDTFGSKQGMKVHHGVIHPNTPLRTSECEWCGDEYQVREHRAEESRFCSHECMWANSAGNNWQQTNQVSLTCERCGDEYEVQQHRAEESRFCSQECVRNQVKLTCDGCGNEYEVRQYRAGESRFCSQECMQNRVTLTCGGCGDKYEVQRHRAEESRFCSMECVWANAVGRQANRATLTCDGCGDEYEVQQHRAEESRFCSMGCTRNRTTLSCDGCGDEYEVRQYRAEESRFCSMECARTRATLTCEVCGEKYEKIQYYAERSRFCSEKCQGSWTSENRTGENSPNWKGGYNPYYGPNWREQRRKVWERDDETCQACGQTTDELGQRPSVHHIIPFRECDDYEEANKLSNLVCLCRSCHGEWEGIPLRPNTAPVDD